MFGFFNGGLIFPVRRSIFYSISHEFVPRSFSGFLSNNLLFESEPFVSSVVSFWTPLGGGALKRARQFPILVKHAVRSLTLSLADFKFLNIGKEGKRKSSAKQSIVQIGFARALGNEAVNQSWVIKQATSNGETQNPLIKVPDSRLVLNFPPSTSCSQPLPVLLPCLIICLFCFALFFCLFCLLSRSRISEYFRGFLLRLSRGLLLFVQ